MNRPILVLRPEPANRRTVLGIEARGYAAMSCPLFETVPLSWTAPDSSEVDAVLITSGNVPRLAGEGLSRFRDLPVHAVGRRSADAAESAGLRVASIGAGDAAALVSTLAGQRLLHLCGAHVTDLDAFEGQIIRVPVYESRTVEDPTGLAEALATRPVVPLHSSRAAARFAELVDASAAPRSAIAIAAISQKVGKAAGSGWQDLAIAAEPRDDALLDAATALLGNLRDS